MKQSDDDSPLISVIVPVYNAAEYLRGCADSILSSHYDRLELLLIDDGSGDGSGKLCDTLQEEDGRVRAFHTDNRGVSAARNLGIDRAQGRFLTFVDADDRIRPDLLTRLLRTIQDTGCDVAGCEYLLIHSHQAAGTEDVPESDTEDAEDGEADSRPAVVFSGHDMIGRGILDGDTRCWSKLYRRDSIGGVRFPEDLSIGEDMLFLLRLAVLGLRFAEIPYRGYEYYSNDAGAMNRPFTPSYRDQMTCWIRAQRKIRETAPELLDRVSANLLISVLLVAGKLSLLSPAGRREQADCVRECRAVLREALGVSGAFAALPLSYRCKVCVFRCCPSLYLNCYHLWKRK